MKVEIQSIAEYDTKGSRLTCCTLADGEAAPADAVVGKRKHVDGENDGEESASDDDEGALTLQAEEPDEDSDDEE